MGASSVRGGVRAAKGRSGTGAADIFYREPGAMATGSRDARPEAMRSFVRISWAGTFWQYRRHSPGFRPFQHRSMAFRIVVAGRDAVGQIGELRAPCRSSASPGFRSRMQP